MKTIKAGGKPLQLQDDETIIWRGQPAQGVIRNPAHIIWGVAFIALGLWMVLTGLLIPIGAILLLLGGHLGFFHAIVEKNRRASTYYLLTNQRAILAYSLRVLSFPISPRSEFSLKKGRFDTVLFREGREGSASLRGFGFGHLENGDDVYKLMLGLRDDLPALNQD